MKRLVDRADLLVLRDSPWGWALFCLAMFIVISINLYREVRTGELDWFQILVISAALIGAAIGTFVFAKHTVIEIDPGRRELRMRRHSLRGRSTRTLTFDEIESVLVETRRNENLQLARVVVHSSLQADLPLTDSYSGNVAAAESLAIRIRQLLGKQHETSAETVLQDSVHAMIAQNRLIDAARMLHTETGISIKDAHAEVHKIKASMNDGDDQHGSE